MEMPKEIQQQPKKRAILGEGRRGQKPNFFPYSIKRMEKKADFKSYLLDTTQILVS